MRPTSPQNAKSSFIPNSTQTPNDYFDLVMGLLTGNEWKVLCFAIRHILGFHDRIMTRTRPISLTTFERGYGNYNGCGLNRKTIIEALKELEKYRLLVPVGEPTQKGQEWYLDEYPDLEGLKKRFLGNKEIAKKARGGEAESSTCDSCESADEGGQSSESSGEVVQPVHQKAVYSIHQKVVQPVHQSGVADTPQGGVADTHNNILHSNITLESDMHASVDPQEPTAGNVIKAWLTGTSAVTDYGAYSPRNRDLAKELVHAGITPTDVTSFLAEPFWMGKSITFTKLCQLIGAWKAKQTQMQPVVSDTVERKRSPYEMYMMQYMQFEEGDTHDDSA